jgi:hypothetical protein
LELNQPTVRPLVRCYLIQIIFTFSQQLLHYNNNFFFVKIKLKIISGSINFFVFLQHLAFLFLLSICFFFLSFVFVSLSHCLHPFLTFLFLLSICLFFLSFVFLSL